MRKRLAILLGLALTVSSFTACGGKANAPVVEPTKVPEVTETVPKVTEAVPEDTLDGSEVVAGTSFDSVTDFNYDAGQEDVWQYYFSGDNGTTFDPCTTYDDYTDSNVSGWHPWTGSYIGVGFNKDVEGFLELNTDGVSTNFSNQMGVLAFCAPATGNYVLTAKVWNPWAQTCDKFTFKKADGTEILTYDVTDTTAVYAYITPTDVELTKGDMIYMYCNSTGSDWVSAYIDCTMVYEPTDDSVYIVPEVEAPEVVGVTPDFTQTCDYNAYAQYDKEVCNGSNVPWVYASTSDGTEFTLTESYKETDYNAQEWFSVDGTGIGQVGYLEGDYLELNTSGKGGTMMALGFVAPNNGTYTFNGYAFNPYSQTAEIVLASLKGEIIATVDIAEYNVNPNEFSFEVTMTAGDTLYFYCPSTTEDSWVSAYLSVFVTAH